MGLMNEAEEERDRATLRDVPVGRALHWAFSSNSLSSNHTLSKPLGLCWWGMSQKKTTLLRHTFLIPKSIICPNLCLNEGGDSLCTWVFVSSFLKFKKKVV